MEDQKHPFAEMKWVHGLRMKWKLKGIKNEGKSEITKDTLQEGNGPVSSLSVSYFLEVHESIESSKECGCYYLYKLETLCIQLCMHFYYWLNKRSPKL
jgi:hypothetical protein